MRYANLYNWKILCKFAPKRIIDIFVDEWQSCCLDVAKKNG